MNKYITFVIVIVASLVFSIFFASTIHASVQNFNFSNFNATYQLGKNADGHSEVRVTEVFVADFPSTNQNKGMVRAIPITYDKRSLHFKLISVERNGNPEPVYKQYTENQNVIIETGTNNYVNGQQEYKITYSLTDVTQTVGEMQEFYWNIIGNQFPQAFSNASAKVVLAPKVKEEFTGELRCYAGTKTNKVPCEANYDSETGQATFTLGSSLPPRASFTVAMQFKGGAFVSFQETPLEAFIINYSLFVTGGLSMLTVALAWFKLKKYQLPKSKNVVIPEYLPPKGVSVMEASGIVGVKDTVITAQIIDLAVRHNIRIIENTKKGIMGRKNSYTIQLLSTDGLLEDEVQFLKDMLIDLSPGATYTISTTNLRMGQQLQKTINNSQTKVLTSQGFTKGNMTKHLKVEWVIWVLSLILSGVVLILTPQIFGGIEPALLSVLFAFGAIIIGALMLSYVASIKIYTHSGRQLQLYLEGLKMYIKLAEAERLAVLQSPQGATTTPVIIEGVEGEANIIKLYERVLPYAVLFKLEKQWVKALEIRYQQQSAQPSWYEGSVGQGLALGAMISGLSTTTSQSFRAPSASSGSGISSGFAGGGGGGGGGGGR